MEEEMIKKFIQKVKLESGYTKIVEPDILDKLMVLSNADVGKQQYTNNESDPLAVALAFLKDYNIDYYNMIIKGIQEERIDISNDVKGSFFYKEKNIATIKTNGNDGDIFMLVHEFAHFIDQNSKPIIIPNDYWYFGEVFSFYMEKQLELWLDKKKYGTTIDTRKNNRQFFQKRMLTTAKDQLYYENLYNKKGTIDEEDLDIEKVKKIMGYNSSNLVNYLLGYSLANIISEYLVNNKLVKNDNKIIQICLDINLRELISGCLEDKVR